MSQIPTNSTENSESRNSRRQFKSSFFSVICLLVSALVIVILITLLTTIINQGAGSLSWQFLTGVHVENQPEKSGISQALVGSIVVCLICGLVALPVGIGTAIYLEEFKPRNKLLRNFQGMVQLNINNLAGVPSIVYGILGVTAFVYMFGVFERIQVNAIPQVEFGAQYSYQLKTISSRRQKITGQFVSFAATDPSIKSVEINEPIEVIDGAGNRFMLNVIDEGAPMPTDPEVLRRTVRKGALASRYADMKPWHFHLPFGKSVLAAGLTLALVILPITIIASQEAIRAVPNSLREAAFGMGATRWQVVKGTVLPSATPGIMTGAILSMSRAIGEAAPLIAVMGGVLGTTRGLTNMMDSSPVLPVTIYKWSSHQNVGYEHLSAAAIIVLLLFLLLMNSIAVWIRFRFERRKGSA